MQRLLDQQLGQEGETYSHAVLKEYFQDDTIRKSKTKFALFDFTSEDKTKLFEVKTRRCSSTQFTHTIVGENKTLFAAKLYEHAAKINQTYNVYFVFNFPDAIQYIRYDPEKFKSYKVNLNGRKDRGKLEYKPYVHIPAVDLITIKTK